MYVDVPNSLKKKKLVNYSVHTVDTIINHIEGDRMHNIQCRNCGYENYTEEKEGVVYCRWCGHIISLSSCPE